VSKRHQANRRKSYGRRRHELQERAQRAHEARAHEPGLEAASRTGVPDRFSFLDPHRRRLGYVTGD
jgi:hypothetical protein